MNTKSPISAVDLFCGCGGMTHGLMQAGISVNAGIDSDAKVEYAYTYNNPGATFLRWDVTDTSSRRIAELFTPGKYRLLVGCAPCQPFSSLTYGIDNHHARDLLDYFGGFVADIRPELVAMENVPGLAKRGRPVFDRFVTALKRSSYHIDWRVVRCCEYGVPQLRKRLILLASRLGEIKVPDGRYRHPSQWGTVRQTIGSLRPLQAGEQDPCDPMHVTPQLSPLNLDRIRATRHDGGSRKDWPERLVFQCHRRLSQSGGGYQNVGGRMWWDRPAPTITTSCLRINSGRYGHPEQDRSISFREAALLQSFPHSYQFWPLNQRLNRGAVSRMIGNAVPPKLAREIGQAIMKHVAGLDSRQH